MANDKTKMRKAIKEILPHPTSIKAFTVWCQRCGDADKRPSITIPLEGKIRDARCFECGRDIGRKVLERLRVAMAATGGLLMGLRINLDDGLEYYVEIPTPEHFDA